jgi:histidyl-tRNA synthetase
VHGAAGSGSDCVFVGPQQAERCNASRLVLVAPDEWANGEVRVKNLATREESNVPLDAVVPPA